MQFRWNKYFKEVGKVDSLGRVGSLNYLHDVHELELSSAVESSKEDKTGIETMISENEEK